MNDFIESGRRKRPNMFKKREEQVREKEELKRRTAQAVAKGGSSRRKRPQPVPIERFGGQKSGGRELVQDWFSRQGWKPFGFQTDTWGACWLGIEEVLAADLYAYAETRCQLGLEAECATHCETRAL